MGFINQQTSPRGAHIASPPLRIKVREGNKIHSHSHATGVESDPGAAPGCPGMPEVRPFRDGVKTIGKP